MRDVCLFCFSLKLLKVMLIIATILRLSCQAHLFVPLTPSTHGVSAPPSVWTAPWNQVLQCAAWITRWILSSSLLLFTSHALTWWNLIPLCCICLWAAEFCKIHKSLMATPHSPAILFWFLKIVSCLLSWNPLIMSFSYYLHWT